MSRRRARATRSKRPAIPPPTAQQVRSFVLRRPYPDPLPHLVIPPTTHAPGTPLEASDGAGLYTHCSYRRLLICHVANEHIPSKLAADLIKQGMVPGWPDYYLPRPVEYAGRWRTIHIELKRACSWRVTWEQLACIEALWRSGQIAELCFGLPWASELVDVLYGF